MYYYIYILSSQWINPWFLITVGTKALRYSLGLRPHVPPLKGPRKAMTKFKGSRTWEKSIPSWFLTSHADSWHPVYGLLHTAYLVCYGCIHRLCVCQTWVLFQKCPVVAWMVLNFDPSPSTYKWPWLNIGVPMNPLHVWRVVFHLTSWKMLFKTKVWKGKLLN